MIPIAALLLASTLHAGPEVAVAPEVRDAQPYVQLLEDAAADDERALVVWQEGDVLRGVRMDRDGATLDAVPLLIAYTPGDDDDAKVARGATNWLVIWVSERRVSARIVEDDGTMGPVIVMPGEWGIFPRVAFNGNQYLAAWYDERTGLHATRVDASGEVLESNIQIAPHEAINLRGLFPTPGGGFLLVAHRTEFLALTLDAQAREVSRRTVLPGLPWHAPELALDGTGRLIAGWPASEAAYVQREGTAPVALEAEQIEAFVTVGGTIYALARGGGRTALWTLDGTLVRELSLDGMSYAVAMGNRVLAAGGDQDVLVTLLDASLQTIVQEHLIYAEPALQATVAVAQAGDVRMVAWTETDARTYRVMARLGNGAPFVVADGAFPQVATDGRDFLITWTAGFYLAFRRVSRDGSLGPVAFSQSWVTGSSCATWNGSEYVVGYASVSNPRDQLRSIVAQRVTREGEPSGNPMGYAVMSPSGVACASTESATLLAWYGASRNVTGAILTPGGTQSAEFVIAPGAAPTVAAQGDGFVVAWSSGGWTTVSEGGTVGTPHELPGVLVRVASRPGGYLLMYGGNPLRVRPLDAEGNFSGPELAIPGAERPAFAGGLLVYERNTETVLPQPRWRVFTRELTAARRRRAM